MVQREDPQRGGVLTAPRHLPYRAMFVCKSVTHLQDEQSQVVFEPASQPMRWSVNGYKRIKAVGDVMVLMETPEALQGGFAPGKKYHLYFSEVPLAERIAEHSMHERTDGRKTA
jgi:hypothetical protein